MAHVRTASKTVITLGWISFLNDLGSEVLTRLVPLFVTGVLGASMQTVGAIEGIADATATLLKPYFGSWSDGLRKRKIFVVLGYGLSSLSRPFLALATGWQAVALIRFSDRVGKGIRNAPRDALIADVSTHQKRGRNFGINRALDTLGAVGGVSAFMLWANASESSQLTASNWITLTLACSVPGFLAIALLLFKVQDAPATSTAILPASQSKTRLSPTLKRYLFVAGFFGLANSSDAFILLRAKSLGYELFEILGMVALLNIVSAFTAIPAAALSDRLGRRALLAAGWTIYAMTYALLGTGWVENRLAFYVLVAVYGLFFGFTESVERAWVADLAPKEQAGRAYGWFGVVVGLSALPASFGFGWAWDRWGSQVPFMASAVIALFSTALLFAFLPKGKISHYSS